MGVHPSYPSTLSRPCMAQDLGADEVLDYRAERFERKYRDARFDAALDVIGGTSAPSPFRLPASCTSRDKQEQIQSCPGHSRWPCMRPHWLRGTQCSAANSPNQQAPDRANMMHSIEQHICGHPAQGTTSSAALRW